MSTAFKKLLLDVAAVRRVADQCTTPARRAWHELVFSVWDMPAHDRVPLGVCKRLLAGAEIKGADAVLRELEGVGAITRDGGDVVVPMLTVELARQTKLIARNRSNGSTRWQRSIADGPVQSDEVAPDVEACDLSDDDASGMPSGTASRTASGTESGAETDASGNASGTDFAAESDASGPLLHYNYERTQRTPSASPLGSLSESKGETPAGATAAAPRRGAAAAPEPPAGGEDGPGLRVVAPTIQERVSAVLARCTGAIHVPADREAVTKRLDRGLRVLCRAAVRRRIDGADARSLVRPTLVVLVACERALATHGAEPVIVLLGMAPAIAGSGPVTASRLAELARVAMARLEEASLTERRGVVQGLEWALEHLAMHVCAAAAIEAPIRRAS